MVNNNQKVYFSGTKSPFDIVSEILGKNGLKETLSDFMTKRREGKAPMIKTLFELSRDLAEEKITEKDFISAIKKQLETTDEVAQKINKDIKDNLLPLAEKVDVEKQNTDTKEKPETINPPRPVDRGQTKQPLPTADETIKTRTKTIKGASKLPEKKEIKKTTRTGSDNYREPIE